MHDERPSPITSIARTINRVRARGPIEVLQLGWTRAAETIRSDDVLVFFSRAVGGAPPAGAGLTWTRAAAGDADDYAARIGTDSAASFRGRLSERTWCYLVRAEGAIVHSSWVTMAAAWTRELRAYVRPPEGDAYIYESFTRSEVRGRGIYPFALAAIVADLNGRGAARAWVAAEADNPASIRAITKGGFEEAFTVAYRRRLGRLQISAPTGERAPAAATMIARSPRS